MDRRKQLLSLGQRHGAIHIRYRLLRSLLLFGVTAVLSACTDQPRSPINIAGNKWLGYQPLFVAYEIGMSHHIPDVEHTHTSPLSKSAHSFSITTLSSTSSVIRLMSNQQLDGAMMTLDEALQYQAKTGMALCVPLVMDYSNGADALIVNPQTFHPDGGNKVRIGYEATALGGYMLRRAIEVLALDAAAIEPQIIEPNDHLSSYTSGRVDGVITFDPYLSMIREAGGEERFSSRNIPKEIIDLLVIKDEVWQQRKKELHGLVETLWREGLQLVENNDPRAIEIISGLSGLTAEEISSSLQNIQLVSPDENRRILQGPLTHSIAAMNNYLVEKKMISKPAKLAACN